MEESTQSDVMFPLQGNMAVRQVYTVLSVVMTFIIPGAMVMICITNLVFFDIEYQSYSSSDWYEVVLLLLSIIALVCLCQSRWRAAAMVDAVQYRFLNLCNTGYGFLGLLCFLAFVSLLTPVFKAVAIASCFGEDAGVTALLRFSLNVIKSIFLICQALFFVFAIDFRCTTVRSMSSIMILVATNACLCIRCFADAVQQTMINNISNDTKTAWGSAFCKNQSDALTEGFRVVDKYFYSFILFYCLYSLEVLCTMWNLMSNQATSIQDIVGESLGNVTDDETGNRRPRVLDEHTFLLRSNSTTVWTRIRSIYCVGLCRYSFIPTAIGCLLLLAVHIVLDIEMQEFASPKNGTTFHKDTTFVWIQTVYENFMAGATFVGLLFVFKEKVNWSKLYARHNLLIAVTCVFALLVSLESFDVIANMTKHPRADVFCVFFFRTLFHFLGLLFQTPFVVKSSDLSKLQINTNKYVYVRGILWFLAITNLERSLVDTFLTPNVLRYVFNFSDDYLKKENWTIAARVLYPVVAFYRLQSSLLCFENLRNLESRRRRQRPDDNAVA